jgi:hypothetical protein
MNKKQKSKKPIYILIGFFVVFGLFIYALTRPSKQSIAIKKLETCFNQEDVKMLWYENKDNLYKDEIFLNEIKDKLTSFNLRESEQKEIFKWLPTPSKSINLIIVPDLSRRINLIPGQIENDKVILKKIRKSFEDITMLKMNSKDKIIITITDSEQAKGRFKNVANELTIDLTNHKNKSNRLFYNDYKKNKFNSSIDSLYLLAKSKPVGADYAFFVRRHLVKYLKKSTLYDSYTNKVIFITDGYIEAEKRPADTKIGYYKNSRKGFRSELEKAVISGNVIDVINKYNYNIPASTDLTDVQVLVCEINERKEGAGYDFEILNSYWKDWFLKMNVSENDINFIERNPSTDFTFNKLNEFIKK